jgi:pyruvate/2-oxoglutarate/acetoin dehydrogenase E1 component
MRFRMSKKCSMAEALRDALREEMQRDKSVFLIGEDIGIPKGFGGPFTVTLGLSDEFGHERIIDTPISENAIVGAAVGAAMMGMRPVAEVQYGDFVFCCMDQIVNQAAKMRYMSGGQVMVPMVLRIPVGATGRGAQHAQNTEAYFLQTAGLKVVAPSNAYDAKGLLKSAIRDNNPVLFFEHKLLYGSKGPRKESGAFDVSSEIPEEDYIIPLGSASIRREGKHITFVALMRMVYVALEAAEELSKEGIEADVIDLRSLVPMDTQAVIKSLQKTNRLVTVEESNLHGGWGSELSARIMEDAFDYLDAPVIRVGAPHSPVPAAPALENYYIPDAKRIINAVKDLLTM